MGRRAQGVRVRWKRGWAYARFTYQGRDHRIPLGTRDADEAQKRAARAYADALSGRVRSQLVARARLSAASGLDVLVAKWIASKQGLLDEQTLGTLVTYGRHFVAFFGSLDEIDEHSADEYVRERLGRVLRTTVKKERTYLRDFLAWCERKGLIDRAPAVPLPPRRAPGVRSGPQRARPVDLTLEQVQAIVAALPEWSKTIDGRRWPLRARFVVAYETGLRPATLAALSVPEHYAPGRAELVLADEDDKARWGRALPLTAAARAALDAAAVAAAVDGILFGAHRFDKALKRAALAAGLSADEARRVAAYDFRHARATHLVAAGASLPGVAYHLGHRQVTTTNRYVHGQRREAERALALGEAARAAAAPSPPAIPAPFPPPEGRGAAGPALRALDLWGDRRVSNPRQLEPQPSAHPRFAEDGFPAGGHEGPEEAERRPPIRPRGAEAEQQAEQRELAGFAADLLDLIHGGHCVPAEDAERFVRGFLSASGALLALEVLDGGPHALARLIRLAGLVLDRVPASALRAHREGGRSR